MTVSVETAKTSAIGDGTAIAIPTVFVFHVAADIEVIERVIATGVETTKTLTTDYTVTGGGGAGAEPATGTVTAVSTVASTLEWHVRRIVAETQGTDLPAAGAFPSTGVETMADRLTMQVQQHSEQLGRSLVFPKTDSASLDPTIPSSIDRVSKFLAFDATGNPIASTGPTGDSSIPVSTYIETLLDDTTAAAARTTLGAQADLDVPSQAEAEAGTATTERVWTAQRVGQAIAALVAAASDTVAGIIEIAVQSEQETGASTTLAVTPGRQHFHPSATKIWAYVDRSAGTPSLSSPSYNTTSVTDDGAAQTIVTIATDFSTAIYSVLAAADNNAGNGSTASWLTLAAGSFKVKVFTAAGAAGDTDDFTCGALGDHA